MNNSATVVITQRTRTGAEEAYRQWQAGIVSEARSFTGFEGIEIIAPTEGVQDDWVIVLHFDTPEHLADWLTSEVRRAHIAEAAEILEELDEHVIATPRGPTAPVAVVVARRPVPGKEAAFESRQRELIALATKAPGYIDAELFRPVSGSDEWTLLFRFANAASLERWMASPERSTVRDRLSELVVAEDFHTVGGGLGGWFPEASAPDQKAPARWKQAFAVTLALFPTAWLLSRLVTPLLGEWPTLAQLVANAAGVVALTWLVMPLVNRVLDGWYSTTSRRLEWLGALAIISALVLMLVLFSGIPA